MTLDSDLTDTEGQPVDVLFIEKNKTSKGSPKIIVKSELGILNPPRIYI
jgi:hypothetical protein